MTVLVIKAVLAHRTARAFGTATINVRLSAIERRV